MNHQRATSLPPSTLIDAKCTACGAPNVRVEWREGSAPEHRVNAEESGRWACPHCGAHNVAPTVKDASTRLKCQNCHDETFVLLFGQLDAPPGEME